MSRDFTEAPRADAARHVGALRPPAPLSASTVVAVRRALGASADGRAQQRLATAAGLVADDARHRGLPPEAMLIALKRTWASLEETRRLPLHVARPLLERLTTLGIDSYYAYRASVGAPGASGGSTHGPRSA